MILRRICLPSAALLLLATCDGLGNGTASRFQSWEGQERYLYGYSATPDELSCDMYWSSTGAPATRDICRDCTFTFEVVLTYDTEISSENSNCTELATDTAYTYAYQQSSYVDRTSGTTTLEGYIGTMYDGYFVSLGTATFDQATGSFSYRWGDADSLYYDVGSYGYYTDLHVGTATVQ